MKRKDFLKIIPAAGLSTLFSGFRPADNSESTNKNSDNREFWIQVLTRIADPVIRNLGFGKLKSNMPVGPDRGDRKPFTHLEAFGRTLAGIAPWLELESADEEQQLRLEYVKLTRQGIENATNPDSPDFMNFSSDHQPLVDAAFMAQGLLRGFNNLWLPLDSNTKGHVISALINTRNIKPYESNWLLFSAMIEAFLLKAGVTWKQEPVDHAMNSMAAWYKGDGTYGDGPEFHWDYYNSFVIHPMMIDISKILQDKKIPMPIPYEHLLARAQRYAVIQERMISPEGAFPPIGRSLCYRFGAFHLLSQMALLKKLPAELYPAQVRSGLSAVIARQINAPGTFDDKGWLTPGFCGHQPQMAESYISTGSLYLCLTALLPLGLPADDVFWTGPSTDWSSKLIWSGKDRPADHAYEER
jgi:hypothetical protein